MSDQRYRDCCNPSTPGAGGGYKVERVSAPPNPGDASFANMNSVDDLQARLDMNPEAGWHRAVTRRIVAMGKVRDTEKREARSNDEQPAPIDFEIDDIPQRRQIKAHKSKFEFRRGMEVKDIAQNKKGIIIQCNVGYTSKSKKPVHKCCDKNGRMFLSKETDLRAR